MPSATVCLFNMHHVLQTCKTIKMHATNRFLLSTIHYISKDKNYYNLKSLTSKEIVFKHSNPQIQGNMVTVNWNY